MNLSESKRRTGNLELREHRRMEKAHPELRNKMGIGLVLREGFFLHWKRMENQIEEKLIQRDL